MTARSATRRQSISLHSSPPDGDFPDYYRLNPRSSDGRETLIFGSVSLFKRKARTVESRYGWYADLWVKIRLGSYVEG